MRGQALLFHFKDKKRLSAVRKALMTAQVGSKVFEEADETTPIGSLIGIPVEPREEPAPAEMTDEVMVLCGLSDNTLNLALSALRKAKLYIPYKASLTPTNKDWSAAQLFAEISEEHEYMQKMHKPMHEQE